MPCAERYAVSASATGVFPAPPATRLPTQMTGTGARYGRAKARRTRLAASQAAPIGSSRSAASPGSFSQNSGAVRIRPAANAARRRGFRLVRLPPARLHRREAVEPWGETGEDNVENALAGG